jgi:hypothetical protein
MTPLLSWVLLLTIGALGAAFALAFARWLEDDEWREWERDLAAWRAMCQELDFDDMPPYDAGEHPHRGE